MVQRKKRKVHQVVGSFHEGMMADSGAGAPEPIRQFSRVPERHFRDDGSLSLQLKMLEELAKAPIERRDLALVERTEEAPDVRGVLGHRRVDSGEALVGESDAEAAPIRRIKCAFDVASGLQPVQPAVMPERDSINDSDSCEGMSVSAHRIGGAPQARRLLRPEARTQPTSRPPRH